jgi:hypothetical protein
MPARHGALHMDEASGKRPAAGKIQTAGRLKSG